LTADNVSSSLTVTVRHKIGEFWQSSCKAMAQITERMSGSGRSIQRQCVSYASVEPYHSSSQHR